MDADTIKANLYAFFRSFSRTSKAEISEDSRAFCWFTSISHPWFNGVLSSQPPRSNETATIEQMVDYFQSRQVNRFTWWLEPGLESESWSRQLLPLGFQYSNDTPGMAVDLRVLLPASQHPPNLAIKQVEDLETLQVWVNTLIQAFGMDDSVIAPYYELTADMGIRLPFRYYLAYLEGVPVATSMLFLGAGAAGIYGVGTLQEARRKGIGAALTVLPLQEARQLGYHVGVLQASEMGFPVYRRLGFQKLCTMEHFYWEEGNS